MIYSKPAKHKKKDKVKIWDKIRAELKIQFDAWGITFCEICKSSWNLSFAHSKKRRNIIGDEIYEVALLCVPCHMEIEKLGQVKMYPIIMEIIGKRKIS